MLRNVETNLNGSGVKVAQVEASEVQNASQWEVSPGAVGQPISLFTYSATGGVSTTFPNALGTESAHADSVAGLFYGTSSGVAPGISHVDNYEANYFYNSNIVAGQSIAAKIVNQSFIFDGITVAEQKTIDSQYDSIAAQKNILFVSGAGNSGSPDAPSTVTTESVWRRSAVNRPSVRPLTMRVPSRISQHWRASRVFPRRWFPVRRRCSHKQERATTAEQEHRLQQRTFRTLKALLLNGAVKTTNWTHTATAPLDTHVGAGILNAFNSYEQLAAGKFSFIESTTISTGGAHPPGTSVANVGSLTGWDFNSISSTVVQDRVNHYYFNVPTNISALVATLVWNRAAGASNAKISICFSTTQRTAISSLRV